MRAPATTAEQTSREGVIYGVAYQVQLSSVPGVGTVIRLEIPELMSAERITA